MVHLALTLVLIPIALDIVTALSANPPHRGAQERRQESLNVGNHPLLSLNLNLDALATAGAAERAQELYERISALYREGYYSVRPDIVSFNSVLKAWQSDPVKALEFWEQEQIPAVDRMYPLEPNVRSYNTFLLALARAGLYEQAETLLRQMQTNDSLIVPDRITYNTVLLACAAAEAPEARKRASVLLEEMIASDYLRPDAVTFNTVLASCVGREDAAEKTKEVMDLMRRHGVEPDVYSYTSLIQVAASSGDVDRALAMLREMQQGGLEPNRVTYTVVMQALCRDRRPQVAQELLEQMIQQSSPQQQPDVVTFSALLDGWAKLADRQPRQAIRAVNHILMRMKSMGLTPNERTYTSVLSALSRSRQWEASSRAEEVLEEMSLSKVPRSVIHWNAVMDAYAKSPRSNKVEHCRRLWNRMRADGVAPDTISYNTLLASAANSFGEDDALRKICLSTAFEIFRALQQDPDCQATSLTFNYLFKAIRKFMPVSVKREELVKHIFHLCGQQGCLNDIILRQVLDQIVDGEEATKDLLGEHYLDGHIDVADLPPEWSDRALRASRRSMKRARSSQ